MQPLWWRCVDCMIHHERDVREEQKYMYVARTSNNRVMSSGDLCCYLLPRCEALRTCRSGFPIATECRILDQNLIFYSFSRLIAIVANTDAHIYAREKQISAKLLG